MNAELPPFKNGEHNSESVSIIDRVITPLMYMYLLFSPNAKNWFDPLGGTKPKNWLQYTSGVSPLVTVAAPQHAVNALAMSDWESWYHKFFPVS